MQLHYALLCTEGLPSIYGLTLIKPQSIGLNRWDLYWLNTLGTKIYCCSIDLLAMKISSHQQALTKITKPFFSEQHWSNQVDKPCCSLMIVNLLSSKKLRWSLWVLYVDHYIFCRLAFPPRKLWTKKRRKLCNGQVSWQDWFGSWCRKHSPSYPDLNFQFVCSAEQSTKSKNHV